MLGKVRAAGALTCGINTEQPEWTLADAHGNHSAFDSDICKAVAVVVLGPEAKSTIKYFRDEASSLAALKAGEIDLLATASPDFRNDNGSFSFARPIFYDFRDFWWIRTSASPPPGICGEESLLSDGDGNRSEINNYMRERRSIF